MSVPARALTTGEAPPRVPPHLVAATDADEYVAFCVGVRKLTGVDLLQYKRGQMERRIRSFAGRRGVERLSEYLELLARSQEELDSFRDRMTINVSQLWRNPEQWARLARLVLPELTRRTRIDAWSAGCSYGAETYTLAAVCADASPGVRVKIRATDIDVQAIARAREGRFSAEDARTAPPDALGRWFERDADGWRARAALRTSLDFEVGDLLRMRFPHASYDLVLCRNVVIYFTDEVRDDLHRRFAESLRPGGYFVIGSTERVTAPRELGLEPTAPFFYRKI
jgi:chemotaxis protein methyltransferase CheR